MASTAAVASYVLLLFTTHATCQECTAPLLPNYAGVFSPENSNTHDSFVRLPGFTRSKYERNYALVTPESRVWASGNRAWPGCKTAHIISRAAPSHFSMFFVRMEVRLLARMFSLPSALQPRS
jgi:hypothetical protein